MYTTTDLGKATYLSMLGHRFTFRVNDHGHCRFEFALTAKEDALKYDQDAPIPARSFCQNIRELKHIAYKARKGASQVCLPQRSNQEGEL
jgi:hypothetical protein